MRILLILLTLTGVWFFGLKDRIVIRSKAEIDSLVQNQQKRFRMPVFKKQYPEGIEKKLHEADSIGGVYPRFLGKYKFADSIDVKKDEVKKGYSWESYSDLKMQDTLDVNGFEVLVDHQQVLYLPSRHAYYPVYFINTTQANKLLLGKDSWVFGIQEAKSGYNWAPIEEEGWDFCGNGHWSLVVEPGEFVVVLIKKYKGELQTDLRVRFRMGPSIYVSKPFPGRISPGQFMMKKRRLDDFKKRPARGIKYDFYGARPFKYESYGVPHDSW